MGGWSKLQNIFRLTIGFCKRFLEITKYIHIYILYTYVCVCIFKLSLYTMIFMKIKIITFDICLNRSIIINSFFWPSGRVKGYHMNSTYEFISICKHRWQSIIIINGIRLTLRKNKNLYESFCERSSLTLRRKCDCTF